MTDYIPLANPFLFPLQVAGAAFCVLLVIIVILALCKRRSEETWYEHTLAGLLAIVFVGIFVLALDVDRFDPTSRIEANVHAKYSVDSLKLTGNDPSSMTVQFSVDGLQKVYSLANHPETSEPVLTQTRPHDPEPTDLERHR